MSTATESLAIVGIQITEPVGKIDRRGGGRVVGSLIHTATAVEIIPRVGITDADHNRLTAAAGQVWLHGPDGLDPGNWHHLPDIGDVIDVWVPEHPATEQCSVGAAAFALSCAVRRVR